jgi:outer membrane autotransporter protein
VQNIISTRLASLRSGDAFSTGVVTGSGMSANSGFIQAFGSQVEQKNKGNEFGYDADTTGFALGVDGKVSDGVVLGISYANSKTDVDGKGTGNAKNDIKTNSGSIYADYTTKGGYVEGSITYGQSDNKGSRILNTGGLDRTYKSDYDSEQYSFRLSGGVPMNLGKGAFFTPFAGATISQIKTDAYTETSTTANDALRLRVAQDTVDSQVGTIGIKYHQAIKDGKTTFTPEVKLAVNQEFGDDTITSTNTYQGGGTSFKNSTAIEKTSATAGVGLSISSDNVTFNIGYEADVRDDYLGHSAQAKITAKF